MPRRATPDPFLTKVGARIRDLREAQELTLEKLAYESDVGSKGYVSDIENGRASASLSTLKKLADRLQVTVAELVTMSRGSAATAADKIARYEPTPRRRSATKK